MERAAPLESIFENTPFCNGIYTSGGGSFFDIWDARNKIRALWGPDRLVSPVRTFKSDEIGPGIYVFSILRHPVFHGVSGG